MDSFVVLILIAIVLSVGGWILWMVVVFFAARAAMRGLQKGFHQLVGDLERSLGQLPRGGFNQLSGTQQQQLLAMLMQAQTQMGQMNDLSRARYETRVGDLMGMAASAGIDWHP